MTFLLNHSYVTLNERVCSYECCLHEAPRVSITGFVLRLVGVRRHVRINAESVNQPSSSSFSSCFAKKWMWFRLRSGLNILSWMKPFLMFITFSRCQDAPAKLCYHLNVLAAVMRSIAPPVSADQYLPAQIPMIFLYFRRFNLSASVLESFVLWLFLHFANHLTPFFFYS